MIEDLEYVSDWITSYLTSEGVSIHYQYNNKLIEFYYEYSKIQMCQIEGTNFIKELCDYLEEEYGFITSTFNNTIHVSCYD